jgi:hypothetical protein
MKITYTGSETHVVVPQPPPLHEIVMQRDVPQEVEDSVAQGLIQRRDFKRSASRNRSPGADERGVS